MISSKNKVAIITGQLVVGGSERQLYLWLSNINHDRFEPVVLTLHPGYNDYWEKPIQNLGIPIFNINMRKVRIFRLLQIINILRKIKPDLIHGWNLFASPYAGLSAKVLCSKSIGGLRSKFETVESKFETKLTKWLTDVILVNSKAAAEQYKMSLKGRKQEVLVVQNAIDCLFLDRAETRNRIVRDFGLDDDALWIGSIGRMDPHKRFDVIIKIMAFLKQKDVNVQCLLIGDGPEREQLEQQAVRIGVRDKIAFIGEIPDASKWLKALDIFCFPSVSEGLPNVIMEAAAAGLPIIAWRLPFIEEILVDEDMAMKVEPYNIAIFEEMILQLIHSNELRNFLGNNARSYVLDHFSLEKFVASMNAAYLTALGL